MPGSRIIMRKLTTVNGKLPLIITNLDNLVIRKKKMKVFTVQFSPLYPVPCGLIIKADTLQGAEDLAKKTITHTSNITVEELVLTDDDQVLFYESGDY